MNAVAALTFAGFGTAAMLAQTESAYKCPGGENFRVRYLQGQGSTSGRAVLLVPGKSSITLPQIPAASGAKYSDGFTTLWTKGSKALIESGSVNLKECEASPAGKSVTFSGMFVYFADSATVTECGTGRSFPVAQEQEYIALERAYGEKRAAPGSPLHVTVQATMENRRSEDGKRTIPTLIVERFISAQPGEQCDAMSTITGNWRVVELAGGEVSGQAPPELEFRPEGRRVAGFTGCNRFTGTWEVNGSALTFSKLASTKKACLGPLMELETRFLRALDMVRQFETAGDQLTLPGPGGEPVARLRRRE